MKFAYTIIYVPDVAASLEFFEKAFGFSRRFLHESGTYGELETGETTLSFAAHELGEMNFQGGHVQAHASKQPLGMEVGFVTEDVLVAHANALAQGATELSAPSAKPWGQVVSYVRCPDGTLVELCTPISG
ncbi:VOC family protein [Pseudomonas sp. KBW05]|uniref:VOC family protein n=1 Tax=Pseudomonas sp. KBW05 TaxID=2153360 RepID=UPI000F59C2F6|nr:VOC family protein [Pseudomonas sp. KBW05]RQO57487.1 glyoxalase [Pseudomonas sp. KBW05]